VATKIAFGALRHALAALYKVSDMFSAFDPGPAHTQAISTHLGRPELGSLTLTNANWMRPSENSSTRSASSPSAHNQHPSPRLGRIPKHTSSALHLEHTLLAAVSLKCAYERGSDGEEGPLTKGR
jgi:hypothetical protein